MNVSGFVKNEQPFCKQIFLTHCQDRQCSWDIYLHSYAVEIMILNIISRKE